MDPGRRAALLRDVEQPQRRQVRAAESALPGHEAGGTEGKVSQREVRLDVDVQDYPAPVQGV